MKTQSPYYYATRDTCHIMVLKCHCSLCEYLFLQNLRVKLIWLWMSFPRHLPPRVASCSAPVFSFCLKVRTNEIHWCQTLQYGYLGKASGPFILRGKHKNFEAFLCTCNKRQQIYISTFFFRYFWFLLIFAPLLISIVFCMSCLMSVWMSALYHHAVWPTIRACAHFGGLVPGTDWVLLTERTDTSNSGSLLNFLRAGCVPTNFDFFFRTALHVYWASYSLYIPYTRLGSMEQEDDETGTKNSNVAVDPESCVTVALPEVRLGMSIITQRLFFCWQNFSTYLFGYWYKAYVDKVGV